MQPPSRERGLDRAETQPLLERKISEELARLLGQVGRIGPAHVLTARAGACFLMPPRAGGELSRMSAAETLNRERIHSPIVGLNGQSAVPETGDSLQAGYLALAAARRSAQLASLTRGRPSGSPALRSAASIASQPA